MSSCVTCNQPVETRWPHISAQEPCECGPLGRVITGRSTPEWDINYNNPYQTPFHQGMQRETTLGKVQIGRKDHSLPMEAPCCEKYGTNWVTPQNTTAVVPVSGSLQSYSEPTKSPGKLAFEPGSFAFGIIFGVIAGAFVWTATGRSICQAVGARTKRCIERR